MVSIFSFLPEFHADKVEPETAPRVAVGAASPLWLMFGGAAMAGASYWWWANRWREAVNLEALMALTPEPVAPPAESVAVLEAEPAPVISEEPVTEEPVVEQEEEPAASAYAPVRGGSAVVGRQGANVRTLPKTGGSQVLFALAAGEEVTVMETTKGWLKVVDSRGRSGWVWSELVRR